jgi:hypothetical protein
MIPSCGNCNRAASSTPCIVERGIGYSWTQRAIVE